MGAILVSHIIPQESFKISFKLIWAKGLAITIGNNLMGIKYKQSLRLLLNGYKTVVQYFIELQRVVTYA